MSAHRSSAVSNSTSSRLPCITDKTTAPPAWGGLLDAGAGCLGIRGQGLGIGGDRRPKSRILTPNFWLLDSLLAGISREVYENKGTGKFQVAKPGGTRQGIAFDDSISGLGGHLWAQFYLSALRPVSRVPCPISRFTKNEGASGDVHENKGTLKFIPQNARKYRGRPTSEPCGSRRGGP